MAASDQPQLSRSDVIAAISRLQVYQRSGRRAVHKPLLLLLALKDIQNGGSGVLEFTKLEPELNALLREFGTTSVTSSAKAHYPFWYLKNDGLWFIEDVDQFTPRTGKGSWGEPPVTMLRAKEAKGGLLSPVAVLLRKDPEFLREVASRIVELAFPETRRQDVLDAVGLDLTAEDLVVKRDAKFRRDVLREYSCTCSVCGYDGRLGPATIGVEAAHIKMVSAGGPNNISNGLALCSLHHKLFDAGAFTIDSSTLGVVVSAQFAGLSPVVAALLDHPRISKHVITPARVESRPSAVFLAWHRNNLFVKA